MGRTQLFGVWIAAFFLIGGCATRSKTRRSKPRPAKAKVHRSAKAQAKALAQAKAKAKARIKARRQATEAKAALSDGDLAAQTAAPPPDIPLTSQNPAGAASPQGAAPGAGQQTGPGCTPLPQPGIAKIRYLPQFRLFFTGLFDACPPPAEGYRKGFFWVGMGVPCTGGEGRIKVVGKVSFPKKVVFPLDNACPMAFTTAEANQPHFAQVLGFPPTAKALALYPLDTIYWHFSGTSAAGIGNDVTIHRGQLQIWNLIYQGRKVPLRMVGRENSFKPSGKLFQVEAMLSRGQSEGRFVVEIVSATVLTEPQAKQVVRECQIRIRKPRLKEECLNLGPASS